MPDTKEARLNLTIPADLRQDITDIAFLTKGLSEKELVATAIRTFIAKLKDQAGEKLEKALVAVREAREV
jgi:hypothetical protein